MTSWEGQWWTIGFFGGKGKRVGDEVTRLSEESTDEETAELASEEQKKYKEG